MFLTTSKVARDCTLLYVFVIWSCLWTVCQLSSTRIRKRFWFRGWCSRFRAQCKFAIASL